MIVSGRFVDAALLAHKAACAHRAGVPDQASVCAMPLPTPTAARSRLHTRTIALDGWRRADGHYEIEARLVDLKHVDYRIASGLKPAGTPIHDMTVRVAVDREFNILEAAAVTDEMPFVGGCDRIHPNYGRLVGMNLVRGFRRAVGEMFGEVNGCAHITELLMSLPTAAIQTMATDYDETAHPETRPFQLDHCHAMESTTETVRRFYPRWYRGGERG